MALGNAIYPLWKQALMTELEQLKHDSSLDQGAVDANRGVYCSLVNTDSYVYSDTHQFYSSVAASAFGTPQLITTASVVGRIFTGDAVVYTNVTGTPGASIGGLVLYRKNAGANTTWRLVLYEDTGIIGLPLIPSGGNIIVSWNIQGIFGL